MAISTITFQLNGQTYTLTNQAGTNNWSAQLVAPADTSGRNTNGVGPGVGANALNLGYYPGIVTVTDEAGNVVTVNSSDVTFGDDLKVYVTEKTKPTGAISYPSASAFISNVSPTVLFSISDSGSGVNASTIRIDVDGTEYTPDSTSFNLEGTVCSCEWTPATGLDEGDHTVTVYGYDYDGNRSDDVVVTFAVDTLLPVLSVSAPVDNSFINSLTVDVVGVTNDEGSAPVVVTIDVVRADSSTGSYTPTIAADGSFTQAVTLTEGTTNVITITAEDRSGKSTVITRTVRVDVTDPVITAIEIQPNPMDNGATYIITVTATDA